MVHFPNNPFYRCGRSDKLLCSMFVDERCIGVDMKYGNLSEHQVELLLKHLELVIEKNKVVNLTRIDDFESAKLLHIEDSLSALPELNDCPEGLYGDLGSGAGYPGIPLAIASGRKTVLVDARKKKMDAVGEIVKQLGLSNQIETYSGRAELLARSRRSEFSALTARALSKISILMELASPLLKKGGRLICYKSHIDETEFEHALDIQNMLGMKEVSDREFELGDEYARRIVVFEKVGESKIKLPRLEGQAQKNPL